MPIPATPLPNAQPVTDTLTSKQPEKFKPVRTTGIRAGISLAKVSNIRETEVLPGFYGGILGYRQISEGFGYGGEINFSQQGATVQSVECALNYLSVPLMLNLHANPVVFQAGLYGAYLFSATARVNKEDIGRYFQETDYGFVAGVNFHTASPTFFSARVNIGIKNINNGFASPKETVLQNRVFQLGAGYKF